MNIRIEAYSVRGSSRTPIAPLHPYIDQFSPPDQPAAATPANATADSTAAGGAATEGKGTIVYHDKFFDPDRFSIVPDTDLTLIGSEAASADSIELRIINLRTQEALKVVLIPQALGFHFKVSDTLMFVKRLGIGTKEKQAGISDFNFGPAPGVAYDSDSSGKCSGPYNGDLVKRADHAGNVSCYTYDGLHRKLSTTYSGPNATGKNRYFVYDTATVNGQSMANAKTRMAEAYTAGCRGCSKVTDEGFGYTARGELSDFYESTPNSGGYYHVPMTYWANGLIETFGSVL